MGLFGALAGVASRFLPAVGTIARGVFGVGRKILSTLGILKEKAQPIIQTVQKGWDVARDAANLIPNPETRGKVQGWMDNVGRQAGNYYNKANDYYNQAGTTWTKVKDSLTEDIPCTTVGKQQPTATASNVGNV
ncbi:hypothetical protein TVAGG3_0440110, partial [Trichomonas vaginalis G3]|uniref:hypothetical protein n=1 Tax=Trichomonas vaginalis (strain ATCC PRA-98 / G3) TaxID=412133 RepID=UPI0021E56675